MLVLLLALSTAHAADRADDYVLVVDTDSTTGATKRTLQLLQHDELDTAKWSAERSAAATSLASWLSWKQTNDQPGYTWLTGLTSTQQEGLRQALLKGS
jgi:hypothetical protein